MWRRWTVGYAGVVAVPDVAGSSETGAGWCRGARIAGISGDAVAQEPFA
ncbi:hypothetical protein TOK_4326 [Pseudonocardia sp. N23]|nr:hypothetical protein TOK_4326 [Pseudonocardia sp. N23]